MVEGGVSEMLMLPSVEEVKLMGEVSNMKVRGWHWEVAKFRAQGKVMGQIGTSLFGPPPFQNALLTLVVLWQGT
jgi:hypothetical protein